MEKKVCKSSVQVVAAAVFFAASVFCVFSASAHSLYIQSAKYAVSKGKSSPLFFCFGHHFPVGDAVRGEKFHNIKVLSPDGREQAIKIRDERSLHSYEVEYEMPGTYVLTAETNPGFFAIYIDKKGRKHHSLKPKYSWIEDAAEIESSMRSSQWTKTYVTCEKPSSKFPAVVGLPLELSPVKGGISVLKEGDSLELQVYADGKPYVGEGEWDATYGGFSSEGEDMFIPLQKIEDGKIVIPLKHGGRWFVRFFNKMEAAPEDQKNSLQEKRTATLSFMVKNERRQPRRDDH